MKHVCVLWEREPMAPAERRLHLLDRIAPALLEHTDALTVAVADEHADVRSPSPFPLFGTRPVAAIDVWPTTDPQTCVEILRSAGYDVHAWPAEESIPSDYGDNEHATPRDWPDGTRSPGIAVLSLLPRPRRLDRDEWVRRWHGVMSPVSARIQPRTRYVRNLLGPPITADAPNYEGAVLECWPTTAHLTSPWLFYGADSAWSLALNQLAIVRAVTHCFPLTRIPAVPVSEYFVRS